MRIYTNSVGQKVTFDGNVWRVHTTRGTELLRLVETTIRQVEEFLHKCGYRKVSEQFCLGSSSGTGRNCGFVVARAARASRHLLDGCQGNGKRHSENPTGGMRESHARADVSGTRPLGTCQLGVGSHEFQTVFTTHTLKWPSLKR